jgi:TPR repeat protein
MNNLALAYLKGKGVPQDKKQFLIWTKRAAEAGNAEAMHNLAIAYLKGDLGVPQDKKQFLIWTKRAAEAGNAEAMNNLHRAYLKGEGAPQDEEQLV